MRSVLALDIGTKSAGSGWVLFETAADERRPVDADNTRVWWGQMLQNADIRSSSVLVAGHEVVFEGISSYDNVQGRDIHRTLLWIGRMIGTAEARRDQAPEIVLRRTAAAWMVGAKPTDAKVAQAVRDRFGGMGATKKQVCGTKSNRGPLYGFRADVWQAMACGIAFVEGAKREEGWR